MRYTGLVDDYLNNIPRVQHESYRSNGDKGTERERLEDAARSCMMQMAARRRGGFQKL